MCGILGEISKDKVNKEKWLEACETQKHRGPDSQGEWFGNLKDWQVSFAHQRLSILDLSDQGSQPMESQNQNSLIIFNGEIYNFVELRQELEDVGKKFNSSSDTEVLLEAIDEWGIEKTLKKLNGMWAFAYLNLLSKKLYLSRDRTGEKPLYIDSSEDSISFSSELKTLVTLKNRKFSLNLQKIFEFLKFGLTDNGQETYLEGINQIIPGTYQVFDFNNSKFISSTHYYWDFDASEKITKGFEEHCVDIEKTMIDSVRIRLRSDVPVGILLSGGIDSTAIACAAKELNSSKVSLLSYVSDDPEFDESSYIDIASRHVGWPCIKVQLPKNPEELFSHLIKATEHMDGPVGSFGNISHYLLMKEAQSRGITVILSGQGADELFCGYKKYVGLYLIGLFKKGKVFRSILSLYQFAINKSILNQFKVSEAKRYSPFIGSGVSFYGNALSNCKDPKLGNTKNNSLSERQLLDLKRFSIPTLNHSEDRMSMAWSREIRLPFLDKRLIEMAISSPSHFKISKGWTKYSLRKSLSKILPKEITWRKDKKGFTHPGGEWLKRDLKSKIKEEYLDSAMIYSLKLINKKEFLETYDQYSEQPKNSGDIDSGEIFRCISLEIWLRSFKDFLIEK